MDACGAEPGPRAFLRSLVFCGTAALLRSLVSCGTSTVIFWIDDVSRDFRMARSVTSHRSFWSWAGTPFPSTDNKGFMCSLCLSDLSPTNNLCKVKYGSVRRQSIIPVHRCSNHRVHPVSLHSSVYVWCRFLIDGWSKNFLHSDVVIECNLVHCLAKSVLHFFFLPFFSSGHVFCVIRFYHQGRPSWQHSWLALSRFFWRSCSENWFSFPFYDPRKWEWQQG